MGWKRDSWKLFHCQSRSGTRLEKMIAKRLRMLSLRNGMGRRRGGTDWIGERMKAVGAHMRCAECSTEHAGRALGVRHSHVILTCQRRTRVHDRASSLSYSQHVPAPIWHLHCKFANKKIFIQQTESSSSAPLSAQREISNTRNDKSAGTELRKPKRASATMT